MARPLGGILIALLLAGPVHAATTDDPRGDVARQAFGEPVEQPAVDLVQVRAEFVERELVMAIEVAGVLPIEGEPDPDRRFSYLFIVGRGANGTLFQDNDLTALCFFHQGQLDLQCEITDGDGALRRSAAGDRNLSVDVQVPWDGPLRVGAFAHESLPNGTQRDIVAQDYTDNAVPYRGSPTATGDPPADVPAVHPWWRTPWLLVVLVILAAAGIWWSQRKRV